MGNYAVGRFDTTDRVAVITDTTNRRPIITIGGDFSYTRL